LRRAAPESRHKVHSRISYHSDNLRRDAYLFLTVIWFVRLSKRRRKGGWVGRDILVRSMCGGLRTSLGIVQVSCCGWGPCTAGIAAGDSEHSSFATRCVPCVLGIPRSSLIVRSSFPSSPVRPSCYMHCRSCVRSRLPSLPSDHGQVIPNRRVVGHGKRLGCCQRDSSHDYACDD